MGLEKSHQSEAYRTLKNFGWAVKMQQDTVICTNCHRPIYPIHAGMPDYYAELNGNPYNIPVMVELKAGVDRLLFDDIRAEQRKWLYWYMNNGGLPFLWLQLGDRRVDSNEDFRRRVWLIPYDCFLKAMCDIRRKFNVKYIPYRFVKGIRVKDENFTALNLFKNFECEWLSNKWRPNKNHSIWKLEGLRMSYEQFDNR